MPDTIDELVRLRAAEDGEQADGDRPGHPDHLRRTRRLHPRSGRGVHRRGCRQGHPRRADHAQLCAVGADRGRADAHRRRAGAVEHAAAAARTGRPTARRLRAVPRDRRGVPRPPLPRRPRTAAGEPSRAARGVDGRPAAAGMPATPTSTRVAETVTPSDTLAIMFTSGSSGPPKGVIHSHGNALRRGAVGPRRTGASTPTPGCICRCRSSGSADSAAACCRRCWPAPRWSPSRSPGRRRHCGCWSASASRCFAAGPTRPRRWHAKTIPSQPICRPCGPAAWRRCCRPSSGPSPVRGRSCSG